MWLISSSYCNIEDPHDNSFMQERATRGNKNEGENFSKFNIISSTSFVLLSSVQEMKLDYELLLLQQ